MGGGLINTIHQSVSNFNPFNQTIKNEISDFPDESLLTCFGTGFSPAIPNTKDHFFNLDLNSWR